MAVIVNLQIQCQQGKGPDFLAMVKDILPDTRAYDGCQWHELAPSGVLRGLMRRVNRDVKVQSHDEPN